MRRFQAKGGYGEHGRSCFLVEYGREEHFYMVDCGIMDSDIFPYPKVSEEELRKTDYLFLTHCHKDHSGAFAYFRERGFSGWLVTSDMTIQLEEIHYDKVIRLPVRGEQSHVTIGELQVCYGRTGHCPGSLWFLMKDSVGSCFFSGDYQADTLFYACDRVQNIKAELAVIDCAHNDTKLRAQELREELRREIGSILQKKQRLLLPVPNYGRGLEMLVMLLQSFSDAKIRVDTDFAEYAKQMLTEDVWYYEDAFRGMNTSFPELWYHALATDREISDQEDYDILLIADTHLKKEKNVRYVQRAVENGEVVMITGRVKAGSYTEQLWKTGKAKRFLYPHHQSPADMNVMMAENHFDVVIPFHNDQKEIIIEKTDSKIL